MDIYLKDKSELIDDAAAELYGKEWEDLTKEESKIVGSTVKLLLKMQEDYLEYFAREQRNQAQSLLTRLAGIREFRNTNI